jgi:hypothetical protein
MRRTPLAPAFVTTLVASGCAWSYGGSLHYTHVGEHPNGAALGVRGAWGLGGARNALTVTADLAMGLSPSHGGFWVQSSPRLEWAWLPRERSLGLRVGAGGLVASTTHAQDVMGGPLASGEALYALSVGDEGGGYRATLLGVGVQVAYDTAGDANGPVVLLSLALTQDGIMAFGNPPPPRDRRATTLQVATDPHAPPTQAP